MLTHPFLKQNYFIFQDALNKVSSLSEFLVKLDSAARFMGDGNISKYGFIVFGEAFLKLTGKSDQYTNIIEIEHLSENSQADMKGIYALSHQPVFIKFEHEEQKSPAKKSIIHGVKSSNDFSKTETVLASNTYGMTGEVCLVISRSVIRDPIIAGQVYFYSPQNLNAFANSSFWSDFRNAI